MCDDAEKSAGVKEREKAFGGWVKEWMVKKNDEGGSNQEGRERNPRGGCGFLWSLSWFEYYSLHVCCVAMKRSVVTLHWVGGTPIVLVRRLEVFFLSLRKSDQAVDDGLVACPESTTKSEE